jgi:hypothetical protein
MEALSSVVQKDNGIAVEGLLLRSCVGVEYGIPVTRNKRTVWNGATTDL